MAKVITFSRVFPGYHPKAGQPTYFVEKFLNSVGLDKHTDKTMKDVERLICPEFPGCVPDLIEHFGEKHHTIRAGHRWKAGEYFKPAVWGTDINPKSGRSGPYHSKQITIGPDTKIEKVWDFEMYSTDKHCHIEINGKEFHPESIQDFRKLMENDGLDSDDFRQWFQFAPEYKKKKRFNGQIICWNPNIEY